ncbi:nucleoside hydrolase [Geopyxis carbonaria]|nr:nucleoside hydrolase [Geopyxis carbonaria]
MAPQTVIIDTDPGVDDTFALLLALSASSNELHIPLITVTFGNIPVSSALRNLISLFHIVDLEQSWRRSQNLPAGFTALTASKPVVAVGASGPIEDATIEYDYFHGTDGLSGIHTSAPHFTPSELWSHLFTPTPDAPTHAPPNFTPSPNPAHLEILAHLRAAPPGTITLISLGPLTNFALAADHDPATFLRAKQVVCMGGALHVPGNVTPAAEFNHYACAHSAARIYALTGATPNAVLPPCRALKPYPAPLPGPPLSLVLLPLDITTPHLLLEREFLAATQPRAARGSPLAAWLSAILARTFAYARTLYTGASAEASGVSLHDPLTVWWVLRGHKEGWVLGEERDLRVEAQGQWTRGMSVLDRRDYVKEMDPDGPQKKHDRNRWLHASVGNRVRVVEDGPDKERFGRELVERILGGGE